MSMTVKPIAEPSSVIIPDSPNVLFHRAPLDASRQSDYLMRGVGKVARELWSQGFGVGFVSGIDSYELNQTSEAFGISVHQYEGPDSPLKSPNITSSDNVDLIIDIASSLGSKKIVYQPVQKALSDNGVQIINGRIVRELESKSTILNGFSKLQVQTTAVDVNNLQESIYSIEGERLVLKPDVGANSKGIYFIDRDTKLEPHVIKAINEKPYVAQKYIYHTGSLSDTGIKVKNIEETRLLESTDRNKQLRIYIFNGPVISDNLVSRGVCRVATPGQLDAFGDKWLIIDQDSIPNKINKYSREILKSISTETKTPYILGACDWVYGNTEPGAPNKWLLLELNLWRPSMVGEKHDPELARDLVLAQAEFLGKAATASLVERTK